MKKKCQPDLERIRKAYTRFDDVVDFVHKARKVIDANIGDMVHRKIWELLRQKLV